MSPAFVPATITAALATAGVHLPGAAVPLRHPWAAGIIFAFAFILISFRQLRWLPIGRPAGAMTGAVLMVVAGVMTPEEAYALVNWDTICLLLGMMILAEYLRDAGLFEEVSRHLRGIGSPFLFLAALSLLAGILSAIFVNDTICVVMTPLLLILCRELRLKPFPYLMALATSSNIGSALTLTGNPQNMIIGTMSRLSYAGFLAKMALPVGVGLGLNLLLLWLYYGKSLTSDRTLRIVGKPGRETTGEPTDLRIGLFSLGVAVAGFFAGFSMAFSALGGAALVIILHRKDPRLLLDRVEWSLLLFFAGLFVVIGGLKTSGLADHLTRASLELLRGDPTRQAWVFSGLTLIGSNLFSNVPYVLLVGHAIPHLPHSEFFWCLLAFASTVAGNLTLIGSVANLIVAELAKDTCEMGFRRYARFGVPSTLLVTGVGTLVLLYLFPV
ncbi:MAG: anion transporter [Candidatus Riflebacteria bacterium]|nr:anion transporter [Candidatus Riflebacteria bacterium]